MVEFARKGRYFHDIWEKGSVGAVSGITNTERGKRNSLQAKRDRAKSRQLFLAIDRMRAGKVDLSNRDKDTLELRLATMLKDIEELYVTEKIPFKEYQRLQDQAERVARTTALVQRLYEGIFEEGAGPLTADQAKKVLDAEKSVNDFQAELTQLIGADKLYNAKVKELENSAKEVDLTVVFGDSVLDKKATLSVKRKDPGAGDGV
jgi:uncharacterized protein YaaW (UPF0174 family)